MAKATKTKTPPRTSDDPVTAYAKAVKSGKIVAGPHVRAACKRHLTDLKDGKARGLVWDKAEATRVIGYFRDVLTVEIEERGDDGGVTSRAVPFILAPSQC